MYKIICNFCGTENLFSDMENKPIECSNKACQNSLEGLEVISMEDVKQIQQNVKVTGLKLVYQKTSEEIIIQTSSKIILGRENFGREVLGKIDQISRAHCSIELIDDKYIVKDLGSTNGTFIGLGENKINCETGQKLNENDFLVLGREVFLVQFLREEEIAEETAILIENDTKSNEPKEILCSSCSCVLQKLPCSCPECGTWNE